MKKTFPKVQWNTHDNSIQALETGTTQLIPHPGTRQISHLHGNDIDLMNEDADHATHSIWLDQKPMTACWSPDSFKLAVVCSDQTLMIVDRRTWSIERPANTAIRPSSYIRFSPNGERIAVVGTNGGTMRPRIRGHGYEQAAKTYGFGGDRGSLAFEDDHGRGEMLFWHAPRMDTAVTNSRAASGHPVRLIQ